MRFYVVQRLLSSIFVLIGVGLVTFSLIRVVPGDVVTAQLADAGAIDQETQAQFRHELGLDRPYLSQLSSWTGGLLQGDLGRSLWTGREVSAVIGQALPVTLELSLLAILLAFLIGIPIGVLSAVRQDTAGDYAGRLFAIFGLSIPDFVFASVVILLLAKYLHWLPQIGYVPFTEDPLANLAQFLVPAAILGYRLSAVVMRITRSSLLEVLREDYVRTAWAKGLRGRTVVVRHSLKNAMIPVITVIGGQIGYLLGGAVIIEQIFALSGLGRLVLDSIQRRDYTVIQGTVLLIGALTVLVNLLVDLSYAAIDPRIRSAGGRP